MNTPFLEIQIDLHQKTPHNLRDFPLPYDDHDSFEEKFLKTRRAYKRSKGIDGHILQLMNAYFLEMLLEKEVNAPLQ